MIVHISFVLLLFPCSLSLTPRSGEHVSVVMVSRLLTLFDYLLFQFSEPVSELMDQVGTLHMYCCS